MNCLTGNETLAFADGNTARLRLNRPNALNALNLPMVRQITGALLRWRTDQAIRLVMIDHVSGRGFCAGGDVLALADSALGDPEPGLSFFFQEYRLNHLMYTFPKPGVVFMDGIVMGGGVGISCPCRYRVVTERTVFAMPETGIGLFPDVGAGRYLSRLRGRAAQWLALTGSRIDGAACVALGLATHFVPHERLDELKEAICREPSKIESLLAGAASTHPVSDLVDRLPEIDRLFEPDEILSRLDASGSEWAAGQAETIRRRSPLACAVTLRLLRESVDNRHFVDEMTMEFGLVSRLFRLPDFAEGVRAVLRDRTNDPVWSPACSSDVVDEVYRPLDAAWAWTPLPVLARSA